MPCYCCCYLKTKGKEREIETVDAKFLMLLIIDRKLMRISEMKGSLPPHACLRIIYGSDILHQTTSQSKPQVKTIQCYRT